MATYSFLTLRSGREFYEKEKACEKGEVENFPEEEKQELLVICSKQVDSAADAERMMEINGREPVRCVNAMMVEELGMLPDECTPLCAALTTFSVFILAGAIPLLACILGIFIPIAAQTAFAVSLGMSGVALFILGAAKVVVTHRNPLRSGVEMLFVGRLAAGAAYLVGIVLNGITG
jgi:VIT1/CCC1 family predicted Fe2+/Mn2+ transporter